MHTRSPMQATAQEPAAGLNQRRTVWQLQLVSGCLTPRQATPQTLRIRTAATTRKATKPVQGSGGIQEGTRTTMTLIESWCAGVSAFFVAQFGHLLQSQHPVLVCVATQLQLGPVRFCLSSPTKSHTLTCRTLPSSSFDAVFVKSNDITTYTRSGCKAWKYARGSDGTNTCPSASVPDKLMPELPA